MINCPLCQSKLYVSQSAEIIKYCPKYHFKEFIPIISKSDFDHKFHIEIYNFLVQSYPDVNVSNVFIKRDKSHELLFSNKGYIHPAEESIMLNKLKLYVLLS